MKPPSTGTWPAVRRGPTSSPVRRQVASMSGTAAVCSASVTSTSRESTQTAGICRARERGGHDPAAGQLAHREDRVGRPRRHVAEQRSPPDQRGELVEVLAHAPPSSGGSAAAPTSVAGDADVAVEQLAAGAAPPDPPRPSPASRAGLDQPIGHLRHRRHDDDRRRVVGMVRRAGPCTMAITRVIASASATEVPPNFMMTFTAGPRGASARR